MVVVVVVDFGCVVVVVVDFGCVVVVGWVVVGWVVVGWVVVGPPVFGGIVVDDDPFVVPGVVEVVVVVVEDAPRPTTIVTTVADGTLPGAGLCEMTLPASAALLETYFTFGAGTCAAARAAFAAPSDLPITLGT